VVKKSPFWLRSSALCSLRLDYPVKNEKPRPRLGGVETRT
jgi:hypothetical protein